MQQNMSKIGLNCNFWLNTFTAYLSCLLRAQSDIHPSELNIIFGELEFLFVTQSTFH